jgi:hypothetical protein
MTMKPKTRKAPAAKPVPAAPPHPHRDVVVTVTQRDDLSDTLHLIQTIDLAVRGVELEEYERLALLGVVEVVKTRIKALIKEFDAFAKRRRHNRAA